MLRHSLIAAAFALATVTSSAVPGNAAREHQQLPAPPHGRAPRLHLQPAPSPYYYGPYYGPGYVPAYAPAAPITALPGAAVCLAFSLIGAC